MAYDCKKKALRGLLAQQLCSALFRISLFVLANSLYRVSEQISIGSNQFVESSNDSNPFFVTFNSRFRRSLFVLAAHRESRSSTSKQI